MMQLLERAGVPILCDEERPADASNPRPGAPSVDGSLRIATFNVDNFFSGIDSGEPDCGPAGQDRCRGADSAEELGRQLAKIATALGMMNADIVAIIELENNASDSLQILLKIIKLLQNLSWPNQPARKLL